MDAKTQPRRLWRDVAMAALGALAMQTHAAPLPDELLQAVRSGQPVAVIVEVDATQPAAATLSQRAARYRALKANAMRPLQQRADLEDALDYSHLPMLLKHVRSEAALRALAALPGVRALHPDRLFQHTLAQSLPLVAQPTAAAAGLRGAGATVAVIDDGIDLAQAAFGGCTAVGTPASCRIAAMQTFVASPTAGSAHGTNVAAIVVGVAPDARVASLDVFGSTGAPASSIINAINWAIANRSSLNIVAISMSLGDASHHATPCSDAQTNPFATPIANARNAGISVVVSAGNNAYGSGVFSPGLSMPACTPGALSVGALYDSAQGGLTWFSGQAAQCTDASPAANQVTCFSNSASYLSLLAPGAVISAGGFGFGGTSQAAPHAAGALAVLRAGFSAETLAAVETRLTANGNLVTDSRSGYTQPRLNLPAAARPVNDGFAGALALSSANGSTAGSNRLATREAGEPATVSGANQSVWWRWVAPASGQVSLGNAGSSFTPRLDVYTGGSLATLNRRAGAASSLYFQAQAGSTYHWAADGPGGTTGDVALQWALNTGAQANLSIALSGPASAWPGSTVQYTLTVSNAGPQAATGVVATLALPAGMSVVSLPDACTLQGASSIVCNTPELASAASVSHLISLQVDNLDTPLSLVASLGSELPDPASADNTVSASLSAADAEVPTLPEWGVLLLAGLLLWRLRAGLISSVGGGSG